MSEYQYYEFRTVNRTLSREEDYVVIDIEENLEEGFTGWMECESTLAAVTPLWNDILNGDYRSLYLIWLEFIQVAIELKMLEKDEIHYPSVPTGLKILSAFPLIKSNIT